MSNHQKIGKKLSEQIVDRTIEKLGNSEKFNERILSELNSTDLTDNVEVKKVISKFLKSSDDENIKTGN
ncbi:MAG: hypothetical protein ACOCP4_01650 [Candidatus Woesearchaeota archaeon]